MIENPPPLTVDEYRQATDDVRSLNSAIVQSHRAALRRQISKLSTLNGKIEQVEISRTEAEALVGSVTLAYAAVVRAHALTRWNDPPGTGAKRLAVLAREAWKKPAKAEVEPDAPRAVKSKEPAPHGTDRRYRAGCSCWKCRKAHATTQRVYRVNRERRERENHNVIELRPAA